MTFQITYRGADGARTEETVEAVSRAACLAQLKARGIAAVSVREGASGGGARRRWIVPVVLGGLGVAALALLLAFFAAREAPRPVAVPKAKPPARPKVEKRLAARPPTATNAVSAPPATAQAPAEAKPKPFNPNEPPPGLLPNEPWRSGRKKLHKVQYVARNTNTVHRNATEQALLDIFSCEVGDPPLPLTDLPRDDLTNMWNILRSPNPITEKDAEEVKVGKDTLELAKTELMKFIKEGGTPDAFLAHYHGILEKAYQKRMIATEEIYKVLEEQRDPEIAREMLKRVNRELREEGIRPLPIPLSVFQSKEQEQ